MFFLFFHISLKQTFTDLFPFAQEIFEETKSEVESTGGGAQSRENVVKAMDDMETVISSANAELRAVNKDGDDAGLNKVVRKGEEAMSESRRIRDSASRGKRITANTLYEQEMDVMAYLRTIQEELARKRQPVVHNYHVYHGDVNHTYIDDRDTYTYDNRRTHTDSSTKIQVQNQVDNSVRNTDNRQTSINNSQNQMLQQQMVQNNIGDRTMIGQQTNVEQIGDRLTAGGDLLTGGQKGDNTEVNGDVVGGQKGDITNTAIGSITNTEIGGNQHIGDTNTSNESLSVGGDMIAGDKGDKTAIGQQNIIEQVGDRLNAGGDMLMGSTKVGGNQHVGDDIDNSTKIGSQSIEQIGGDKHIGDRIGSVQQAGGDIVGNNKGDRTNVAVGQIGDTTTNTNTHIGDALSGSSQKGDNSAVTNIQDAFNDKSDR